MIARVKPALPISDPHFGVGMRVENVPSPYFLLVAWLANDLLSRSPQFVFDLYALKRGCERIRVAGVFWG